MSAGNGSDVAEPAQVTNPSAIKPRIPATPLERLDARIAALEARIPGPLPPVKLDPGRMVGMEEAKKLLSSGSGGTFDGVSLAKDPSPRQRYYDRSTVIVCPTRGQIDSRVIECWNGLIHAMNQRRLGPVFARGYEVGAAYDELISGVLQHPELSTWKYVLTLEDDNLPPPDAHLRLLETLEEHPEFDAVAGLYHTKDALQTPMAYGDPEHFRQTGKALHFPVDRMLLDPRGGPVEVLGIPMGCTLWRMDLFRKVPPSWFMTLSDLILVDGKLVKHNELTQEQSKDAKRCMTQDLAFCEIAVKQHGCRFAVVPSIRVGHLDTNEGIVY